jgi:hypothetical protein
MAKGRTPSPQKLLESLEGSELAKRRMRWIMLTLSHQCAVQQACEDLGISEAAFHKLRRSAMRQFIMDLEPKRRGRPREAPPQADPQMLELQEQNRQLTLQLTASRVREEIALAMPHLLQKRESPITPTPPGKGEALKKTIHPARPRSRKPRR